MITPAVLLITNERDVTTDLVVRALRAREVAFYRLNTERLPRHSVVIGIDDDGVRIQFSRDQRVVDLGGVHSIWYRRPLPVDFEGLSDLSMAEAAAAQDQWRAVLWGLMALEASWMNPPDREIAAEMKLLQLRTALRAGFNVLPTCVTNAREAARDFIAEMEEAAVIKTLAAAFVEDESGSRFVYTRRVSTRMVQESADLEAVPYVLQRMVAPKTDVRVVTVGEHTFAARPARQAGGVDWRFENPSSPFESMPLPTTVKEACIRYLGLLGLRFGAFDFAIDDGGYWHFLECNPNGEWGWIQRSCEAPIADAVVDVLISDGERQA